ncbi:hypothetical protein HispidOSU_016891, partial [Sigmodon hispidus]
LYNIYSLALWSIYIRAVHMSEKNLRQSSQTTEWKSLAEGQRLNGIAKHPVQPKSPSLPKHGYEQVLPVTE